MSQNRPLSSPSPSIGNPSVAVDNDGARLVGSAVDPAGAKIESEVLSGGSTMRKGIISLFDQGIVSATNFLTMVMVGRTTEHDLGVYQLGLSVVMLATGVQMALICMPYAAFGNRMQRYVRASYAGSMLIHQGTLALGGSLSVAVIGAAVAVWLKLSGANLESSTLAADLPFIWILAAVLPFILLREFVRRIAFAHLQVVTVLLMDFATSAVQLSSLFLLSQFGRLSAPTALCVVGASCAATGIAVFILLRREFSPTRANALGDLRKNWSFGKWAFAAQIAYLGIVYSIPWMVALLKDTHATGQFAACLSVVMIANPILLGLNNFLYPQAIRVFDAGGLAALRRLTFQATSTAVAIVSLLMIALMLFGGKFVATLYQTNLDELHGVMTVMAVNIVLFALGMGMENGLMTLRSPKAVFGANMAGLALTLLFGLPLIYSYSVMGAAITTLIGQITAVVAKGYVFLTATEGTALTKGELLVEAS